MTDQNNQEYLVFVGTYTRGESVGIYVYRMDASSGAMTYAAEATGVDNPSFLAFDPTQRFLYTVNEIEEFGGMSSGAASAFSINWDTGALTFLNQQPSGGPGPCHLTVDATGSTCWWRITWEVASPCYPSRAMGV